jgi:hypothetical protein
VEDWIVEVLEAVESVQAVKIVKSRLKAAPTVESLSSFLYPLPFAINDSEAY